MDKKIEVKCECEGTGFVAVAENGGEGIEHVELGQHHPALKDFRFGSRYPPKPFQPGIFDQRCCI